MKHTEEVFPKSYITREQLAQLEDWWACRKGVKFPRAKKGQRYRYVEPELEGDLWEPDDMIPVVGGTLDGALVPEGEYDITVWREGPPRGHGREPLSLAHEYEIRQIDVHRRGRRYPTKVMALRTMSDHHVYNAVCGIVRTVQRAPKSGSFSTSDARRAISRARKICSLLGEE